MDRVSIKLYGWTEYCKGFGMGLLVAFGIAVYVNL